MLTARQQQFALCLTLFLLNLSCGKKEPIFSPSQLGPVTESDEKVTDLLPAPLDSDSDADETQNSYSSKTAHPGICGHLYDIHLLKNKTTLPDFNSLTPIGRVVLPLFNIENHDYKETPPGVPANLFEFYAIDFRGYIVLPKSGKYKFGLRSDDGSRLYIDGKQIVNANGIHNAKYVYTNTVDLIEGPHKIRLQYFQGPGAWMALQLYWTPPGDKERSIVPESALAGAGSNEKFCY